VTSRSAPNGKDQSDESEVIPSEAATLAHAEQDPYPAAMLTWLEGKATNTR